MKCKIYERYKNYDETCKVDNHYLFKATLECETLVKRIRTTYFELYI